MLPTRVRLPPRARGACLRHQEGGDAGILRLGRPSTGRPVCEVREGGRGQEGVWLHGRRGRGVLERHDRGLR
uniref:Uncharacterized protein n=1 Tax=Arundo donax TaxID=35708 RepID=A0A0A9FSA1_ARUDO